MGGKKSCLSKCQDGWWRTVQSKTTQQGTWETLLMKKIFWGMKVSFLIAQSRDSSIYMISIIVHLAHCLRTCVINDFGSLPSSTRMVNQSTTASRWSWTISDRPLPETAAKSAMFGKRFSTFLYVIFLRKFGWARYMPTNSWRRDLKRSSGCGGSKSLVSETSTKKLQSAYQS